MMTPLFAHLYTFALACIFFLAPHAPWKDALVIADASAYAASTADAPIVHVDSSRERTVAYFVATAQGESSFRASVTGDGGKSFGPFQIFGRKLAPREAALEALRQMRISLAMCHDLTAYFAGHCVASGVVKDRADWRERVALRLYSEVTR